MKSMTGYGEASQHAGATRVSVQVRSLNHRHLDLQLRVPREYLSLEEDIRKTIRDKISRGRIELHVNRMPGKEPAHKLEMDEALLGQYLASIRQAKKKFQLAGEVQRGAISKRAGSLPCARNRSGHRARTQSDFRRARGRAKETRTVARARGAPAQSRHGSPGEAAGANFIRTRRTRRRAGSARAEAATAKQWRRERRRRLSPRKLPWLF